MRPRLQKNLSKERRHFTHSYSPLPIIPRRVDFFAVVLSIYFSTRNLPCWSTTNLPSISCSLLETPIAKHLWGDEERPNQRFPTHCVFNALIALKNVQRETFLAAEILGGEGTHGDLR